MHANQSGTFRLAPAVSPYLIDAETKQLVESFRQSTSYALPYPGGQYRHDVVRRPAPFRLLVETHLEMIQRGYPTMEIMRFHDAFGDFLRRHLKRPTAVKPCPVATWRETQRIQRQADEVEEEWVQFRTEGATAKVVEWTREELRAKEHFLHVVTSDPHVVAHIGQGRGK